MTGKKVRDAIGELIGRGHSIALQDDGEVGPVIWQVDGFPLTAQEIMKAADFYRRHPVFRQADLDKANAKSSKLLRNLRAN